MSVISTFKISVLIISQQYQAAHAHSEGHSIHMDIGAGLQSGYSPRTIALLPGTVAFQVSEKLRGELVSVQRHANVHFSSSSVANVLHQCRESRVGIDDAVGDIHGMRVRGSERSCVVNEFSHSQQWKASHLKTICNYMCGWYVSMVCVRRTISNITITVGAISFSASIDNNLLRRNVWTKERDLKRRQ